MSPFCESILMDEMKWNFYFRHKINLTEENGSSEVTDFALILPSGLVWIIIAISVFFRASTLMPLHPLSSSFASLNLARFHRSKLLLLSPELPLLLFCVIVPKQFSAKKKPVDIVSWIEMLLKLNEILNLQLTLFYHLEDFELISIFIFFFFLELDKNAKTFVRFYLRMEPLLMSNKDVDWKPTGNDSFLLLKLMSVPWGVGLMSMVNFSFP